MGVKRFIRADGFWDSSRLWEVVKFDTIVKMKKTASMVVIIIIFGLIGLYLDGFFLPNKPCRPITYPDGKRTTNNQIISTNAPLDAIVSFYDVRLGAKNLTEIDIGAWGRERVSGEYYVYQCYRIDLNGLTTESGCIYVEAEGEFSSIETQFYRSEGSFTPCPK